MTRSISAAGMALMQAHEGFHAQPAPLPDGAWVVGHGHVRIGDAGAPVSRDEAAQLLALDVAPFEKLVNAAVTRPLTQAQFDALVSFAFSIGAEAFMTSQVLRRINAGDLVAGACAMDAWRKSDASGELEVVGALVRRRAAEKALFLQDVVLMAAPSALMRAQLDHAASVLGAPIAYGCAPTLIAEGSEEANRSDPARRLTEILKSEPATEALLLTQVAPDDVAADEITTAHAKPVPRPVANGSAGSRSARSNPTANLVIENAGLIALMLFGVGLVAIGCSMWLEGRGDAIDLSAGAAIAAPGLAAALMAGFGLARTRQLEAVKA